LDAQRSHRVAQIASTTFWFFFSAATVNNGREEVAVASNSF
jgi:hypothetical protein